MPLNATACMNKSFVLTFKHAIFTQLLPSALHNFLVLQPFLPSALQIGSLPISITSSAFLLLIPLLLSIIEHPMREERDLFLHGWGWIIPAHSHSILEKKNISTFKHELFLKEKCAYFCLSKLRKTYRNRLRNACRDVSHHRISKRNN